MHMLAREVNNLFKDNMVWGPYDCGFNNETSWPRILSHSFPGCLFAGKAVQVICQAAEWDLGLGSSVYRILNLKARDFKIICSARQHESTLSYVHWGPCFPMNFLRGQLAGGGIDVGEVKGEAGRASIKAASLSMGLWTTCNNSSRRREGIWAMSPW